MKNSRLGFSSPAARTRTTSAPERHPAARRTALGVAGALGLLLAAPHAQAQSVSITTTGSSVYVQNFDTLAPTPTGTTTTPFTNGGPPLTGLYARQLNAIGAAASTPVSYRSGDGTATNGSLWSLGNATSGPGGTPSTERALGSITSGTVGSMFYGFQFTNNTGVTLTGFTLSYTGEEWRQQATSQQLTFFYSTTATNIGTDAYPASAITTSGTTPVYDTAYTEYDPLNFVSPASGVAGALDGNAAANRSLITGTVSGLNVAPGGTFWLRWGDINDSGGSDALAIDDLSLGVASAAAPAPEPNGVVSLLIGAGFLGTAIARRRRVA